jgi:hypothetical protein
MSLDMPRASAQEWLREPERRSRVDRDSARHQACGCAICVPLLAQNVVFAGKTTKLVPPREIATNFFRFFASCQHGPTLVNARQMAQNRHGWSLGELQMSDPSHRCCAICVPTGIGRPNGSQGWVFSFCGDLHRSVGGRAVVQAKEANIIRSTHPQIQFH